MNKKIIPILYGMFAFLCCFVATTVGGSDTALQVVGYCCTAILFFYLYCDFKVSNRFTYSALFVLILFLFHFGQLMLLTYFAKSYEHVRFLVLLDTSKSIYGFRIMTYSLASLCFGILWKSSRMRQNELKSTPLNIDPVLLAKKIIYATFFVKFALDITTLFISFTAGGNAARVFVNSFPNILLFYGKISLLGFALLLVAWKKQPKKQKRLFFFIIGYILIMMLSGIRSENVGYLSIFLFVYLQSRLTPLNVRQVLTYGVAGFFGLTFIVAVGQFRSYTDKGLNSFMELSENLLTEENVLLGLFDTCGDTGYTAQETINEYLPKFGPSYGDAYYKGITAVVPNLLPFIIDLGKITEESSTPIKLQKTGVLNSGYVNIGGSFFAEQYLNFGIVGGIFICFLWGMFFGYVGKISAVSFETNNIYQLIITIPLMLASIYWVRSYFGGGIREAIWDILMGLYLFKKCKR